MSLRFEDNGFDVRGDLISRWDVLFPKILRLLVKEENELAYGASTQPPIGRKRFLTKS